MSAENFSRSYRSELASRLLAIEDHHSRRVCLDQEKETLNFQLARGEKLAIQRGETYVSKPILDQKEFQQRIGGHRQYEEWYMSNESCLYKLFPVIEEKTDAIVALGSDQGFDLFVNSQASHLFMVDVTKSTSLFTRTLLEIGSRHKKTFGHYPNPDEFIEYFKTENNSHIFRFLEPNLTSDEISKVSHLLHNYRTYFSESKYYRYLEYKKNATNDEDQLFSWNSTNSNLEKIFRAYDEGRIFVLKGNIGSQKTIENIRNISQSLNCSIGTIYLSNAECYWDSYEKHDRSLKNIMELPFSKDAVLLRTTKNGNYSNDESKINKITNNRGLTFYSWHYNAQTIDSIKSNKRKSPFMLEQKINELCNAISPEHPEKGVTLIGFNQPDIST